MKTCLTILIVTLVVVVASDASAFSGVWPLTGNTNTVSWYEALQQGQVVGEMYSSVVERVSAAGLDPVVITETYHVYGGPSNWVDVVTNIVGDVTNIYYYTSQVAISFPVVLTNQWGEFSYSFESNGTTSVGVGTAYLTRSFLRQLFREGLASPGGGGGATTYSYFVNTNYASGTPADFDTWFSTLDGDEDLPADFPMWNMSSIFVAFGLGFSYTTVTDSFGVITGPDIGLTGPWPLQVPTSQVDISLAHMVYSGGSWNGRADSVFFYDKEFWPEYSNAQAVITYELGGTNLFGGTNPVGSVNVKIRGKVQDGPPQFRWANLTTTTTVSALTTYVDEAWAWIQDFESTNTGANTGDVILLKVTNDWRIVGDRDEEQGVGILHRLYAEVLDERQQSLPPLLWTAPGASWQPARGTNNTYYWVGQATGGWEAAKADALTNVTITTESLSALAGSKGTYAGGLWTAEAWARESYVVSGTIWTGKQHTAQFYFRPESFPDSVSIYDDQGNGYTTNVIQLLETVSGVNYGAVTSAYYGQTSLPTWCADPYPSSPTSRGYSLQAQRCLMKWNFDYQ